MFLPIIEPLKYHYDVELHGWIRGYFHFHRVMGLFLTSLLIASLTGLVK
jgi:hypothetical protein